eukprot:3295233-Pleurochrysis_carterae.AAC.1
MAAATAATAAAAVQGAELQHNARLAAHQCAARCAPEPHRDRRARLRLLGHRSHRRIARRGARAAARGE